MTTTAWLRGAFTPRRILAIIATWAVLDLLLTWLDLHPQPLGLFGIVGFGMLAHFAYASPQTPWSAPVWHRASTSTRQPNRADGRLRFIRRQLEQAVDHHDLRGTDLNARRVQELLREVARDQLQAKPGLHIETVGELRTAISPRHPELSAYLFADPAPHLKISALQDIVQRIEEL